MLKRHQVLLEDWLVDYIKFLAEYYDLSFSEVLRILICIEALVIIPCLYPKYKPPLSLRLLISKLKEVRALERDSEAHHRLLSRLYFEARKMIELRMKEGKKKRNSA